MYFDSISALAHMGGYAAYVWPCYGVTFLVLLGNIIAPIARKRRFIRKRQATLASKKA